MNPELFIIPLLAGSAAYKLFSYIYYLRLRQKLKGGSISDFKEVLGSKYFLRPMYSGLIRYKWKKAFVVVKANFDDKGNLRHNGKVPFRFFKLRSEVLFT